MIGRYAKAVVAVLTAAAVAAQTVGTVHGWPTASDWSTIALAALGAIGVYLVPNQSPPIPAPRTPPEKRLLGPDMP